MTSAPAGNVVVVVSGMAVVVVVVVVVASGAVVVELVDVVVTAGAVVDVDVVDVLLVVDDVLTSGQRSPTSAATKSSTSAPIVAASSVVAHSHFDSAFLKARVMLDRARDMPRPIRSGFGFFRFAATARAKAAAVSAADVSFASLHFTSAGTPACAVASSATTRATTIPRTNGFNIGPVSFLSRTDTVIASGGHNRRSVYEKLWLVGSTLTGRRNWRPREAVQVSYRPDAPMGIEAAHAAGMTVVALTTSFSKSHFEQLDQPPALVCGDFDEFLADPQNA